MVAMIPLRIVETEREDFDGPIVELWRDDDFVGMVFWDGEAAVVQIYPDEDGDVHDLEIRELLQTLDTAERMRTIASGLDPCGAALDSDPER